MSRHGNISRDESNGSFVKETVICEEHNMMSDALSGKKEFMQVKSTNVASYDSIKFTEGKNSAYIRSLMETIALSEGVDFNNVDDMRMRFYSYLKYCAENDLKIGNQAAYASFGCSKQLADRWASGIQGKDKQDFILEVKRICSAYRESIAQDGNINPAIAIFWAKNFDGLRDDPQESVTETSALGEPKTAAELAEKYSDLED